MRFTAESLRQMLEERLPTYPVTVPVFDETKLFAFARVCKASFADAPIQSPEHAASWAVLREHAEQVYDAVKNEIDITFVDTSIDEDIAALRRTVFEQGKLAIWTGCSKHPLWSERENWIFRVAHDVIPHVIYGRPFTLEGEALAYYDHMRFCPEPARVALFTEVIGYACGYYLDGVFPDTQKTCALLRDQGAFLALQ